MKAKQFYFLLIALIILSAAGIVGAFVWSKDQLQNNAYAVSDLLAERDAQRDIIILLQQAQVQSDEVEEVSALLERLLPTEKNQETLILDIIYTATAEAGIPVSNITTFSFSGGNAPDALSGTQPFKEVAGVLEYPFNLALQDITYEAFLKLLTEVETNGRIVQVENVQISPSKADPGFLSNVTLSMKAFLKP
jgi:Tfp pilus assembly protein PilO